MLHAFSSKCTKLIPAVIVCFIPMVFLICMFSTTVNATNDIEVYDDGSTVIVKTVAHKAVPETYKLICKNDETDVAYYSVSRAVQPVLEGYVVTSAEVGNMPVVSTTPFGFYCDITNLPVKTGMSGTPILYNGQTIGYMSSITAAGYLYCIWR